MNILCFIINRKGVHGCMLPSEEWGSNPQFWTFTKIFISTLFSLPFLKEFKNILILKNNPLSKIEILGILVAVSIKTKYIEFLLDDCTGIVSCKYWIHKYSLKESEALKS